MPAGIQIYNPVTGNIAIDYTDRMFKFFGVAYVGTDYTGTAASGVISNGLFNAYSGNVPFAFTISGDISVDGYACRYSFPGNGTLVWTFPGSNSAQTFTRPNTLFAYGIY